MSLKHKLAKREMRELRKLGLVDVVEEGDDIGHFVSVFTFEGQHLDTIAVNVLHLPEEHIHTVTKSYKTLRAVKSIITDKNICYGTMLLFTKKFGRY